ncbi:transcription factor ETV6 isoform X2 [Lingula anatina]|uniref:Transcription factor ETV6 isoform X2 n=1 Tax=Lingula anatina TaxID=7574 RepID=A0A1S3HFV9_LINAN|nr:transcription factor ETV6 isoform X2 [Lingula anatina]|eukprot:XP_013384940.1 transcription factor ETV6 isoform X2 [Lingula anatina]
MITIDMFSLQSQGAVLFNPWQAMSFHTSGSRPPMSPTGSPVLASHPYYWSKEDVQLWLKWCVNEYSLSDIPVDKFSMNGKALTMLKKEDFIERVPNAGDILYNTLQKMTEKCNIPQAMRSPLIPTFGFFNASPPPHASASTGSPPAQHMHDEHRLSPTLSPSSACRSSPHAPNSVSPSMLHTLHRPTPVVHRPETLQMPLGGDRKFQISVPEAVLSPAPSTDSECAHASERGSPHAPLLEHEDEKPQDYSSQTSKVFKSTTPGFPAPRTNFTISNQETNPGRGSEFRLLWEFISRLLMDNTYSAYIRWEDYDQLVFRIVNPTALAQLWGIQKNRTNMTYEKLSRALRYYYKMDIIQKVPGKRLTYKFLHHPMEIKRARRGAKLHPRPTANQTTTTAEHSANEEEAYSPYSGDESLEESGRTLDPAPVSMEHSSLYRNSDRSCFPSESDSFGSSEDQDQPTDLSLAGMKFTGSVKVKTDPEAVVLPQLHGATCTMEVEESNGNKGLS